MWYFSILAGSYRYLTWGFGKAFGHNNGTCALTLTLLSFGEVWACWFALAGGILFSPLLAWRSMKCYVYHNEILSLIHLTVWEEQTWRTCLHWGRNFRQHLFEILLNNKGIKINVRLIKAVEKEKKLHYVNTSESRDS